ncbi:prolyl oligopeptidase family serine peptidase [Actinoallomurus vinaceus]|uniref:prolyl oligopeptidase family serine peptidase n=1 Tax=Actinoallomurus vinaceus TaxID=1080074 RepID=UPI0031EFA69C
MPAHLVITGSNDCCPPSVIGEMMPEDTEALGARHLRFDGPPPVEMRGDRMTYRDAVVAHLGGDSAGGHLAALLAVTGHRADLDGDVGLVGVSSAIQACVDWYGPAHLAGMQAQSHPLATEDHDAPDSPESRLLGAPVQTVPERAALASPVTHVSAGAAPILIMHGVEDRLVPFEQSRMLADAFDRAGAYARFISVDGADHVFAGVDHRPLVTTSIEFLSTTLRAAVPQAR